MDRAEQALAAVHETHVLAQAREIEARRKPARPVGLLGTTDAVNGWVPAEANPLPTPVPQRPVFNPPLPTPPTYSADELAELLALVHDLRVEVDGRWHAVPVSLVRLRDLRARWIDHRQDELTAVWRSHPAVQRLAAAEVAEVAERQQERREQQEREAAQQRRADQLFAEAIGAGMSPAEANALVRKQFGDVA